MDESIPFDSKKNIIKNVRGRVTGVPGMLIRMSSMIFGNISIHRNFSDPTIIAIIATELKALLMLNTTYSRSLFLVFIKDKSLKIISAIIQNTVILEKMLSFDNTQISMYTVSACHCVDLYILCTDNE